MRQIRPTDLPPSSAVSQEENIAAEVTVAPTECVSSVPRYIRSKALDDDFSRLAELSPKRVLEQVRKESVLNPSRTREEVLVSLCRHWRDLGKSDDAWALASVLTSRIKGRVARTLQVWKLDFPPALRDEIFEEIATDFYESLFDQSQSSTFWEARFWLAFDRNLLDIVRRRRKEHDHIPAYNQQFDDEQV
jgi:hypothetical protein